MKTLLAFLVLCSVSYGAGPRYTYRVVRTYQVPTVRTCTPCNCTSRSTYVAPTYPIANAVVETVKAPILFFQENASRLSEFQENKPVRNVIKSITPDCANGQCKLK